jgi:hypothetical protein
MRRSAILSLARILMRWSSGSRWALLSLDPEAHAEVALVGLDVDVGGPALDGPDEEAVHQGDGGAVLGRLVEGRQVDGVLGVGVVGGLVLHDAAQVHVVEAVDAFDVAQVERSSLLGRAGKATHHGLEGLLAAVVAVDGLLDGVLRGDHDLHRAARGAVPHVVDGEQVGGVRHGEGDDGSLAGQGQHLVLAGRRGGHPQEGALVHGDSREVDRREAVGLGQQLRDLVVVDHPEGHEGPRDRAPIGQGPGVGLLDLDLAETALAEKEVPDLRLHGDSPGAL